MPGDADPRRGCRPGYEGARPGPDHQRRLHVGGDLHGQLFRHQGLDPHLVHRAGPGAEGHGGPGDDTAARLVRTEFHQRAGIKATNLPPVVWIDADVLVRQCLADVARGRIESVPTLKWKIALFVADHGPRSFIRWFSHKLSASRRKR